MASPRSPTRRSISVREELDIGVARGHALALVEGVELVVIAVFALADFDGAGESPASGPPPTGEASCRKRRSVRRRAYSGISFLGGHHTLRQSESVTLRASVTPCRCTLASDENVR